jgi:hypothetical protein
MAPRHSTRDTYFGTSLVASVSGLVLTPLYRPETVESLFIAYRLTGDPKYRRWGWKIFEAIQEYCRVPTGGYVGMLNVDDKSAGKEDKMETFFLVCALPIRRLAFLPLVVLLLYGASSD